MIVDATRAGGADADADLCDNTAATDPPENTTPRWVSRFASIALALASRLATLPSGHAELPGRFLAGHALQVAQDDDAPVVVGQAAQLLVQHGLQVGASGLVRPRSVRACSPPASPAALRFAAVARSRTAVCRATP